MTAEVIRRVGVIGLGAVVVGVGMLLGLPAEAMEGRFIRVAQPNEEEQLQAIERQLRKELEKKKAAEAEAKAKAQAQAKAREEAKVRAEEQAAEKQARAEAETVKERGRAGEFVAIKGGCFEMGSPGYEGGRDKDEGLHQVCVEGFRLGKTEVTVGQYRRFAEATGYRTDAEKENWCYQWTGTRTGTSSDWRVDQGANWRDPGFRQGEEHPVACVSWNDANAYAEWLRRETGKKYRLPTEAEWEYACRGGRSGDTYCGGNTVGSVAWYSDNSGNATHPVGQKNPNGYGLYDMSGNVWEWTCSAYAESYDGSEKLCNTRAGVAQRVLRGGGWNNTPDGVRSAVRTGGSPDFRYGGRGFRLAQGEAP